MNPLNLRQDSGSPQQRLLRGVHETFARTLSASLSAFLQCEIEAGLETTSLLSAADFQSTLQVPACIISFQLDPLPEPAFLSFDCPAVFGLLELLLGGKLGSGATEARNLTELEWTLLEEVVRVLVGALGESWKMFHAIEFKVQSLESDPERLPMSDPALQLVKLTFSLRLGEQSGGFQIAVPQTFFETAAAPAEKLADEPAAEDLQRNLALLGEAKVDLEVLLEGPTMEFKDLAGLNAGQVVRFDYPLQKPLRALVNGATPLACQIVSVGRKRAFQVEERR
jgi:flagellar motor switch protein FliM